MAENLESSPNEMLTILHETCPAMRPAIFPAGLTPSSLDDLCSSPMHLEQMKLWLAEQPESAFSFITSVDYSARTVRIDEVKPVTAIDSALTSLETMMRLIVLGDEGELNVAISRFLEINGHCGSIAEERHKFNEAYNIAYAIKVLLSNTAGMSVYLGEHKLPLNKNVHIGQLLSKLQKKKQVASNGHDDDDDDIDDEDSTENEKQQKKRKRRRGKA